MPRLHKMRETGDSTLLSGLSTGFKELDQMGKGLHLGELIVIAARPSMGKQQFAWQIAMHVACELKETVAYFSMNQSRATLLRIMTGFAAQIDLHRLRENQLNDQEWESYTSMAQKIANSPLIINDSSSDPRVIREEAKFLCKSDNSPKLIVVDRIPTQSDTGSEIGRRMSNMSADIYRIARDNGIPVIALAGISREVESRKCKYPMLADVASADGLQWYADTVITLYRDAIYNRDTEEKDTTHITMLKSFYGGGGGFDLYLSDLCFNV
jgi:replicative DNA helicase